MHVGNISLTTRKSYVSIGKCMQKTYHLRLVSDKFPLENGNISLTTRDMFPDGNTSLTTDD